MGKTFLLMTAATILVDKQQPTSGQICILCLRHIRNF